MSARRTARRVRNVAEQLEQLEQLGSALELATQQRAKDQRDRAAGVIALVEVAPGVFAMPAPRPPAPRSKLLGEAREMLGAFEQLRGVLWPK